MSNETNSLIQKLSIKIKEDDGKKIAQHIFKLCGADGTEELLSRLLSSSDVHDGVSAILLAGYLEKKEFLSKIHQKFSPSSEPEIIGAFLRIIPLQKDSQSKKFFLQIIEEQENEDILKECLNIALAQKPGQFAKALELFLKKNQSSFSKKLQRPFQQMSKKKFLTTLKTLLRQREEAVVLFAFRRILERPMTELASPVTKLIDPEIDRTILKALLDLFPVLPESAATLEGCRKLLSFSQEVDQPIWEGMLHSFEVIIDGRQRVAVEYFKSWFTQYSEGRQVDILEFIGKQRDPSDVEFLCLLISSSSKMIERKALHVLRNLDPQECFYEIFRFMEGYPGKAKDVIPLLLEMSSSKGVSDMEELTCHLPTDFQKDLLGHLSSGFSHSTLTSALLKNLCHEYTKLDEFGTLLIGVDRLAHSYEREKEITHILKRLKREGNKSFILLGPSGTGKSAIFNELAYRLISHPNPTYPFEMILQITTGDILAGTKYLGEWETRVNKLIQTLKSYKRVILYVSNINDLIWAGRSSSSRTNFASVMSPYIERGDIVLMGESTPEAYAIGIGSEYNIKKLFQTIQLKEMDDDGTEAVLKKLSLDLRGQILRAKNVEVETPSTVRNRIIELATYYFPGIAKPGSAAHLLQQVMETRSDSAVQDEVPKETKRLSLTPDDVMRTLSDTMEVPELIINDNIRLNLEEVRTFFNERVLGQETAVSNLVSLISLIKAGLTNPERPHGVFFFIGPTGVGKTEMARVLAEYLTGDPDRLLRIDMSAFKDYSSFERLIGSQHHLTPQGTFMTSNLVEKIRNHPFSVILLDEFEKAHPNIFDLFLQVFDYGKLLDARSETIDFRQSIIIMTSNIGYEDSMEDKVGFEEQSHLALSSDEAKREMARIFRPEFINRLDKIVIFNPLDKEAMLKITYREVGKILTRSGILRRNLDVKVDKLAVKLLLEKGFSPRMGARQLKRVVEELLLQPLAETIVKWGPDHGSNVFVSAKDDEIQTLVRESRAKSRNTRILERIRKKNKDTSKLVTTQSLKTWVDKLREKITSLESHCEAKDYHRLKRELFQRTMGVTFWDSPEQARTILEEIHYLERILYSTSKLKKTMTDLNELMKIIQTNSSRKILAQAALRYMEAKKEYEILEFEAHCESKKERSDAFISLALSAPSKLEEQSSLEILWDMYARWTEKNAFVLHPLSEELFSDGSPKSITFCIQGVCVYGLLALEAGFHNVQQDEKSDRVEISILPKMGPRLGEEDFEILREKRKQKGYFFQGVDEMVVIKHHYSNLILKALYQKDTQDMSSLLKEWLASKLQESPQEDPRDVRTYYLDCQAPKIYDHILEASFNNVEEMMGGEIDELFIARIKKNIAPGAS